MVKDLLLYVCIPRYLEVFGEQSYAFFALEVSNVGKRCC